jgi:hypothetical protein
MVESGHRNGGEWLSQQLADVRLIGSASVL